MRDDIEIVKTHTSVVRKRVEDDSFGYGKLPPQVKDLEEAVLGAIMIESDAIHLAIPILRSPDFFYVDAHQRIFKAIKTLYTAQRPIDSLTVVEQLKKHGDLDASGGVFAVVQLTNKIGSAANIEFHSRLIAEKYLARQIISTSSELIKGAYEDEVDIFDLLGAASLKIDALNAELGYSGEETFAESLTRVETETQKQIEDKTYTIGIKTKIREIDRISGGFKKGNLIILAARPAMGKTALALDIARRQAKSGDDIAIFSYEMERHELIQRMIAAESQLPFENILKAKFSDGQWEKFKSTTAFMKSLPLHINDNIINIQELKSRCRVLKRKFDIKQVIIDYLQLMPGTDKKQNREQEISAISRELKLLAKELKIPIIALSQLSRECEKRPNKRPLLSDLRESGAIEQDADVAIMLYRDSYYTGGNDMTTEINFVKHRNGNTGAVKLTFDGNHQCFWDIETPDEKQEREMRTSNLIPFEEAINKSANTDNDDLPF